VSTDTGHAPDGLAPAETTPEYAVGEYLSDREFTAEERRQLRDHYGRVRTHFRTNAGRYGRIQRWLNQARIGATYDEYLAASVRYSMLATLLGAVFGLVLSWGLLQVGVLGTLRSPLQFPGDLGAYVTANRLLFAGGALTLVTASGLGFVTWWARVYYPRYLATERSRMIDLMLPYSITYMYALTYGGTNLVETVRAMADADDVYGEVANEFETIRRDMDVFGTDLVTALRNARNVTPSESMERFLDDLLAVLDSGGDPARFFDEQSDKYLREAKERQEYFLETLAVLSELFVFGFIAAPLFVIVTLMVISFLGGSTLLQMGALIYVVMPLAMVAFIVYVDVLSTPYVQPPGRLDLDEPDSSPSEAVLDDRRYANYARDRRRRWLRSLWRNPFETVRERPLTSLVVTVPLAALAAGVAVFQGWAEPSVAAFTARPVSTTTLLVVVPLLAAILPLSYYYERRQRRADAIVETFPDTLNVLSSANAMGVRLTDALGMVSRYSTGALSTELRQTRNDVAWNQSTRTALLSLGNRLKVPHLTRSLKLIADGGRSSDDLSRILAIAAEDSRDRARVERDRRRAMNSYIAIVAIGFLVYLMVIVLINGYYLAPFAEVGSEEGAQNLPVSITNVPIETYRALFFHSVLIQGLGAGLLAGKLADNRLLAGLKYSIVMVVVAVAVFLFI
jgi:flagellar protein FlaJ